MSRLDPLAEVPAREPATHAVGLFDSGRPDSVDTDPAGSVIVTFSFEDGRTPIFQRRFSFFTTRSAERTLPLVTVNALSLSVVCEKRPGKLSLNTSSNENRPLPSCSAGIP